MNLDEWITALKEVGYDVRFPERTIEILDGIEYGMDIGYTGKRDMNRSCKNQSSLDDKEIEQSAHKLIMANVAAGKTAGPFDSPPV